MHMATHIRRILVGIGDVRRTPHGELRKAGALARAARATVELLHAIDEPDPANSFPETATQKEVDQHRGAIVEKYRRRLERFAGDAALRAGLPQTISPRRGRSLPQTRATGGSRCAATADRR
jgi:hypothetical protein